MARAQKIRIAKEPTALGTMARGTYRFLSGRPLYDGEDRTDATWTHKGTRSHGDRRASWWSYQTKTTRVGARLGGLSAVLASGYGLATDPAATLAGLHGGAVGLGSLGAGVAAFKATDACLAFTHNRDYVWPLHVVLKEALNLPEGTRPRHYLTVPRDYHEMTGDAITVELPAAAVLSGELQQRVESACTAKLALQDVMFAWHVTGREHHVIVKQRPRPPAVAAFADDHVQEVVEAAAPDAPVIGISHSGRIIAPSLDTDSPHMLVMMGTGGGKSVFLKCMAAQLMHHGAKILVVDYKQNSQPWIRRIPGVRYARAIPEIHDALVDFGEEGDRRRAETAAWIDAKARGEDVGDAPDVGPRYVCLFEEANTTIPELKEYWNEIRGKDDAKVSPALRAYRQALNMGRSEQMHMIVVGQEGRFNVIGDRVNFGIVVLGKYNKRMWNLVADGAGTAPKKSKTRGRVQVVMNDTAHETQVVFFTDDEALEWASGGAVPTAAAVPPRPAPRAQVDAPAPASHAHAHAYTEGGSSGEMGGESHTDREREPAFPLPPNVVPIRPRAAAPAPEPAPESAPAAPEIELVNMNQASLDNGRGILPMNAAAIRQARRSDPEFPPPDGKVKGVKAWKPETLQRWYRNRPRTANK